MIKASRRVCGVKDVSSGEAARAEARKEAVLARLGRSSSSSLAPVSIDVFFHILTSSSGQGALSEADIDSQMDVLNSAFGPHFGFVKRGVQTVESSAWFSMRMGQASSEGAAKQALRQVKGEWRVGDVVRSTAFLVYNIVKLSLQQ